MHGLDLLFTLSSSNVQSLVLLFNAADFALNFLYPVFMGLLLAFMILTFEFADFLKLGFFLNF